jgi:hypothetical protein
MQDNILYHFQFITIPVSFLMNYKTKEALSPSLREQ